MKLKYLFYFLMILVIGLIIYGSIYTDDIFFINIYDSYYVISYKHLGVLLGIFIVMITLFITLYKRIKIYRQKQ